jgi:hypothetical protein
MKQFLYNHRYLFVIMLLGMTGGYFYWRFIGCTSGSCPITSNWYSSVAVGGIFGYLAGDTLNDWRNKKRK